MMSCTNERKAVRKIGGPVSTRPMARFGHWVYHLEARGRWVVGQYDPAGHWHQDSEHRRRGDAASRMRLLAGLEADTERTTPRSA